MYNVKIKLKTKFTISIILVVLMFGTINILLIRKITKNALQEELDKRGLFIAKSIAEQITNDLLHDDILSAQQKLDSLKYLTNDIAYAFILNNNGKLIAHNLNNNFPIELINANRILDNKEYNVCLIIDKKNKTFYRDIALPILDSELGVIRIGIKEKVITNRINEVIGMFTLMVIAFLFTGIFAAFIFAHRITSPISKIINGFELLDLDKTAPRIMVNTKDELEYLSKKFNQMVQRLQKTHRELSNAQKKLIHTEKLASIGTLVAGIAHEINNPLAGLKNCLNRIKKNPAPYELEKYLNLMTVALSKIEHVINGLLNFSRISNKHFMLVSIKKVINHALALTQYQLTQSSISVKVNSIEDPGYCFGDHHQLEQVMVNLILNAKDAMHKSGTLTINVYTKEMKIYIEVIDTGMGIEEINLSKIFDPFFTTKEMGKGTGLGLPISYNFIKSHGGDIIVKSKVNGGTKMIFYIPEYKDQSIIQHNNIKMNNRWEDE